MQTERQKNRHLEKHTKEHESMQKDRQTDRTYRQTKVQIDARQLDGWTDHYIILQLAPVQFNTLTLNTELWF